MTLPAQNVRVSHSIGARIRRLREGRRWSIADAALRVNLSADVWEAFERGGEVAADDYQTILRLFGFTPNSMAFIDNAGKQGEKRW